MTTRRTFLKLCVALPVLGAATTPMCSGQKFLRLILQDFNGQMVDEQTIPWSSEWWALDGDVASNFKTINFKAYSGKREEITNITLLDELNNIIGQGPLDRVLTMGDTGAITITPRFPAGSLSFTTSKPDVA